MSEKVNENITDADLKEKLDQDDKWKKLSNDFLNKKEFSIGKNSFIISKIKGTRAALCMTKLFLVGSPAIFSLISFFSYKGNKKEQFESLVNILGKLDVEYILGDCRLDLYKGISVTAPPYILSPVNLYDNLELVEESLEPEEILELVARAICINFMKSWLDKYRNI